MRGSFFLLAVAVGGMIVGAGIERVRARAVDESPPLAVACPADARDDAGEQRAAERVASGIVAVPAGELTGGPASPGVPPACGGLIPAPGVPATPRRNRQQRATSAQLDAMVALLREHDGAAADVGEDAVADQGVETDAASGEIRTSHARAVLQGMREGFAAAMVPAPDRGSPGSATSDDRRTSR